MLKRGPSETIDENPSKKQKIDTVDSTSARDLNTPLANLLFSNGGKSWKELTDRSATDDKNLNFDELVNAAIAAQATDFANLVSSDKLSSGKNTTDDNEKIDKTTNFVNPVISAGPSSIIHTNSDANNDNPKNNHSTENYSRKVEWIQLLKRGELIEDFDLNVNEAKLILKDNFNIPQNYHAINQALFNLYDRSIAFQEKFERPSKNNAHPCLRLKDSVKYENGKELLADLKKICNNQERINAQLALAQGDLIDFIDLQGNQAKLVLQAEFNCRTYYRTINQTLARLHRDVAEFSEKFEEPKRNFHEPCLTIRANYDYNSGIEILRDLIDFARKKIQLDPRRRAIKFNDVIEADVVSEEVLESAEELSADYSNSYVPLRNFIFNKKEDKSSEYNHTNNRPTV